MTANSQKSPMPHIIPGIISFIMVHLTRLARNGVAMYRLICWRPDLIVLPIAM
jgi:hypothetical protein